MSDEKKDEKDEVEKVDESELVPDPGPPATSPEPRPLSEEELEERRKAKQEAEDAARKEAEGQPEDASVEEKERNPVLVNKEQFDTEWPLIQDRFPGIEPAFGKEKDGYVELTNVQAPAMAFAAHCDPPIEIIGERERTQHGWDDYVDNSRPGGPVRPDDREDGDIEAHPKRRPQQKVTTTSKS